MTKLNVFSVGILVIVLAWLTTGLTFDPFLALFSVACSGVAFFAFLLTAAIWSLECKQPE